MYILDALKDAAVLISSLDREIVRICLISIAVSGSAVFLAAMVSVPSGMIISHYNFFGKNFVLTLLNALLAMPTVVIGLLVYGFISRQGPLGRYGILFTPYAMIIGQFVLACPIITGMTVSAVGSMDKRISRTALTLGASPFQAMWRIAREAGYAIWAGVIAGFGRVFGEIGISMILGGNIKNYTRNITTAIAYETGKGEFSMALALGIILLTVAFTMNIFFHGLQKRYP